MVSIELNEYNQILICLKVYIMFKNNSFFNDFSSILRNLEHIINESSELKSMCDFVTIYSDRPVANKGLTNAPFQPHEQ